MTAGRVQPDALAALNGKRGEAHSAEPALLGLGTALPPHEWSQHHVEDELARRWNLRGAALDRWRRICRNCGVERRFASLVDARCCVAASTAQRMQWFEHLAPPLALQAAGRAIESSGIEPARITDLIVVSCTGFAAPGLDVKLVDELCLSPATQRLQIGFMGCFGGITGLRTAGAFAKANPRAVVLVVCVELCTLHVRDEPSNQNMVGCALFGDGAAAAIVGSRRGFGHAPQQPPRIGAAASRLLPGGRDEMTWRITDAGFEMTLSPAVPRSLQHAVAAFVADSWAPPPRSLIVHPGSKAIIDAVGDALRMNEHRSLDSARRVLRDHGNLSSASVLFVLEDAMQRTLDMPAIALAFGPGLTIEGIALHAAPAHETSAQRLARGGAVR